MSAPRHIKGTFRCNGEVLTDAGLVILVGLHCARSRYRQQ